MLTEVKTEVTRNENESPKGSICLPTGNIFLFLVTIIFIALKIAVDSDMSFHDF